MTRTPVWVSEYRATYHWTGIQATSHNPVTIRKGLPCSILISSDQDSLQNTMAQMKMSSTTPYWNSSICMIPRFSLWAEANEDLCNSKAIRPWKVTGSSSMYQEL
ncbi:hypothetical protein NXS19_005049 [Fusarium pseudograminearum]|nr:hypothetical protein NXS19_005049 [Fusarium pseudograminearum]